MTDWADEAARDLAFAAGIIGMHDADLTAIAALLRRTRAEALRAAVEACAKVSGASDQYTIDKCVWHIEQLPGYPREAGKP